MKRFILLLFLLFTVLMSREAYAVPINPTRPPGTPPTNTPTSTPTPTATLTPSPTSTTTPTTTPTKTPTPTRKPAQPDNPPTVTTAPTVPAGTENRYAACDLCGYCPPNDPPESWESCRACIYPDASGDPAAGDTLRVIDNVAPTPASGNMYTMIGCINTGVGFTDQSGQANVVQVILSILFSIAGGIALLYLLYAAFLILTSQSDPERLNYGKRLAGGAVAGLIFCLFAVFLVNLIGSGILRIPGFGEGP